MYMVETVDDRWNHIAYVLIYAPDGFPYRDFLSPDGQMNLDRAFELLRKRIFVAYPEDSFFTKRERLFEILDRAYATYQARDVVAAGHMINDFQDLIFKP